DSLVLPSAARVAAEPLFVTVADIDGGAVSGLARRHHVAGNQIGEWCAGDLQRLYSHSVAAADAIGPFVDRPVGVGLNDHVDRAAIPQRYVKRRRLSDIALTGGERGHVWHAGDQHRAGIELAVERQIDVVGPIPGGDRRTVVGNGVAED